MYAYTCTVKPRTTSWYYGTIRVSEISTPRPLPCMTPPGLPGKTPLPILKEHAPTPPALRYAGMIRRHCCFTWRLVPCSTTVLNMCSFGSLASKGFPDGYSTGDRVCVRFHSATPNLRADFRKLTPEEHPLSHRLADGPLSSL